MPGQQRRPTYICAPGSHAISTAIMAAPYQSMPWKRDMVRENGAKPKKCMHFPGGMARNRVLKLAARLRMIKRALEAHRARSTGKTQTAPCARLGLKPDKSGCAEPQASPNASPAPADSDSQYESQVRTA